MGNNGARACLLIFCATSAQAEENKYCAPPEYVVRAHSVSAATAGSAENLFTEEERKDPDARRRLASTAGPYGHSALGFRYLSRLFGYPGKFGGPAGDQAAVEKWIHKTEVENSPLKDGLSKIWGQWVVSAKKRLPVPTGAVGQIPGDADASLFFENAGDQIDHANCVVQSLDQKFCENYLGSVRWGRDDRVTFGKAEKGRRVCSYTIGPINLELQKIARKHASEDIRELNEKAGASGAGGKSGQ